MLRGGTAIMDIKYDVAITNIGKLARTFLENNNSTILLDEGIRPNLADMVIEHTHGELAEDIKEIYNSYVNSFLEILDDPSIADSIEVLDPEQQSIVTRFKNGEIQLDAMYAPQLKSIISSLYHGMTAVEITQSDLVNCFSRAMSVDEAKNAFNDLVTRMSSGKANPRIIVKLAK